MKLHFIGTARSAAYYRLTIPYLTLARKTGATVMYNFLPDITPIDADVLILHKPFLPYLEVLLDRPHAYPIVTDLDDLLWSPPPWNDAAQVFRQHPEYRKTLLRFLRESDHVTVSTERLKSEVKKIAPKQRVTVLPNMLDLSTFVQVDRLARYRATRRVTIGWYGSKSHVGPDLSILTDILWQAVEHFPEVYLHIIGPESLDQVPHLTRGWPACRMSLQSWVEPQDLPKALSVLDIGLAPLAEGPFNACKSDLKPLEYAAAGVYPILSDVSTYRSVPVGRRCKHAEHWIDGIQHALQLFIYTLTPSLWPASRSIETNWHLWQTMLKEVTDVPTRVRTGRRPPPEAALPQR